MQCIIIFYLRFKNSVLRRKADPIDMKILEKNQLDQYGHMSLFFHFKKIFYFYKLFNLLNMCYFFYFWPTFFYFHGNIIDPCNVS